MRGRLPEPHLSVVHIHEQLFAVLLVEIFSQRITEYFRNSVTLEPVMLFGFPFLKNCDIFFFMTESTFFNHQGMTALYKIIICSSGERLAERKRPSKNLLGWDIILIFNKLITY